MKVMIDLSKEMAWVTFLHDGWETKWYPVTDIKGTHLKFDDTIMDYCRQQFNSKKDWFTFGIAPTSQMIINNSVRDNM